MFPRFELVAEICSHFCSRGLFSASTRVFAAVYVQKGKKMTGRCPVLQYADAKMHVSQSFGKGDAQFFNVKQKLSSQASF